MRPAVALIALATLAAAACGGGTAPAALDTRAGVACASCRMTVTNARTASQIVAPGEEPLFFDDLGCLREYRAAHATAPGAAVYVADHQTGAWAPAAGAVYARAPGVDTPMGSHLLAWASAASRDADPASRGAERLDPAAVLGPPGAPR
jgi:copper chaperone NosL